MRQLYCWVKADNKTAPSLRHLSRRRESNSLTANGHVVHIWMEQWRGSGRRRRRWDDVQLACTTHGPFDEHMVYRLFQSLMEWSTDHWRSGIPTKRVSIGFYFQQPRVGSTTESIRFVEDHRNSVLRSTTWGTIRKTVSTNCRCDPESRRTQQCKLTLHSPIQNVFFSILYLGIKFFKTHSVSEAARIDPLNTASDRSSFSISQHLINMTKPFKWLFLLE